MGRSAQSTAHTRAAAAAGPLPFGPARASGPGPTRAEVCGQAVAVLADRPAHRPAAFRVACQLAAYWMSRGVRVALRPSLTRPRPGGVPLGEGPVPALFRWVRRYRRRAQFSVAYLAPLALWAGEVGRALTLFDRLVVVSAGVSGAFGDGLRTSQVEPDRLVGVVVQAGSAPCPPQMAVYLGRSGRPSVAFCGPEPLAIAYVACQMMMLPLVDRR